MLYSVTHASDGLEAEKCDANHNLEEREPAAPLQVTCAICQRIF